MRLKILLACCLAAPGARADGPYRFPTVETLEHGRLYVISGKDDPEAIPYWSVWNGEFQTIRARKEDPKSFEIVYGRRLKLSAEEWSALYAAADAQAQRDQACKARHLAWEAEALKARGLSDRTVLYRLLTPAEEADPLIKELGEKQMAVHVACRADDLAAADALMATLSPSGQQTMVAWLDSQRRAMTAYEHPNRMRWYYLPAWRWAVQK